MGKTVAVLGSSGGNLYSQGGNDPQRMFSEIMTQARSADMEIVCVLFIGTDKSMDGIAMDAKAKLYTLSGAAIEPGEEKTLAEINQDAKRLDSELVLQNNLISLYFLVHSMQPRTYYAKNYRRF